MNVYERMRRGEKDRTVFEHMHHVQGTPETGRILGEYQYPSYVYTSHSHWNLSFNHEFICIQSQLRHRDIQIIQLMAQQANKVVEKDKQKHGTGTKVGGHIGIDTF